MKKLLITGGSGFIGEHLIQSGKQKFEIYATCNEKNITDKNVNAIRINLVNLKNVLSLLEDIKPEIIIHTAAISNPDICEKDTAQTNLVNVKATESLAKWSKKNNIKFIFTSSDMVFDGRKGNYHEKDNVNPLSFYANTKVVCERKIVQMNFNAVVVRVALTYGLGKNKHNTFFEKMISNLTNNRSVTLFTDQFRTPILVNNLADSILELTEKDFNGIIHLCGGQRISRWDFGLLTCKTLGLPTNNLKHGSMFDLPDAATRPQDISMNNDLAKRILDVKFLNCPEGLLKLKETKKQSN